MKRFLVFSYADYYPAGGVTDLCGAYDSFEEALAAMPREDTVEILDTHTGVLKTAYGGWRYAALEWGKDEDLSEKLGIVKTG